MFERLKTLFGLDKPPSLPVLLDIAEFETLMPTSGAFPRPNWEEIHAKIEREYSEQLNQAWQDFAHIWLTRLSYRLEQGYRVQRSAEFILLCTLNERRAGFVLKTLEGMRQRILDTLGWSQQNEGNGLYTVLLFADSTTYLNYIQTFGPEGEEESSVGQFIPGSYGHIALVEQEIWRIESTLAYLLAHYILGESNLPWWLQNGLCCHFSDIYNQGEQTHRVNLLQSWLDEAAQFWTPERVRELWDGSLLGTSYKDKAEAFALILTRVVLEAVDDVPDFLGRASWHDAGSEAVLAHTGQELSVFVEGILGPGDWTPQLLQNQPE